MTDNIFLEGMIFLGRHGVSDEERAEAQEIEVDVTLEVNLAPAGASDDLSDTVDYSRVFETCRQVVEERSFHLLEGIAHAVAADVLAEFARVNSLTVRVEK